MNGKELIALMRSKIGQEYILGARVPLNDPDWNGPWDCAESVSWGVFQATGRLYGTSDNQGDPAKADPYTGYWERDVNRSVVTRVTVAEAASIAGAIVLRFPRATANGHIVFSDGNGGTVEAHSHKDGVIASVISGRRWDTGIIVPGLGVSQPGMIVAVNSPSVTVYRLRTPFMRGGKVGEIQRALSDKGFHPGNVDEVFGRNTAIAVADFQAKQGLLSDGEVGKDTAEALDVKL